MDNELMDILENAIPKSWQGEMCRQHFDFVVKGQAKFIRFCKNLELLEPSKQAQMVRTVAISSTGTNQQIPEKKGGRDANAPSLSASQAWEKATKYCMLYSRGRHTTNKCNALKKKVKSLKDKNDGNYQSCLANNKGCLQCYNKEELNTIIGKSIKAALKKKCFNCD
eukprot:12732284-Ditylum_brightwellii.AAC.1